MRLGQTSCFTGGRKSGVGLDWLSSELCSFQGKAECSSPVILCFCVCRTMQCPMLTTELLLLKLYVICLVLSCFQTSSNKNTGPITCSTTTSKRAPSSLITVGLQRDLGHSTKCTSYKYYIDSKEEISNAVISQNLSFLSVHVCFFILW